MKASRLEQVFLSTPKRFAATMTILAVCIFGSIIIYNGWDSWFPMSHPSGYDAPTSAQVQAVTSQDIPVQAAPAPQASAEPVFHTDPKFPGMHYAAPGAWAMPPGASSAPQAAPAQQAAAPQQTVAAAPPSGMPYDPKYHQQAPPQQANYAPPQQQAPAPDPSAHYAASMADVRAEYAEGIKNYNDALYRLHNLNGADMVSDSLSMGNYYAMMLNSSEGCSPSDKSEALNLINDLGRKMSDIDAAGKSSPTGGGY